MSTPDTISVMDQYAGGDEQHGANVVQSGLAHVGLPEQLDASRNDSTVTLIERPVTGLLMLRATSEAEALSQALKNTCGVSLSARLQIESYEAYCIRWMSPDCWLLSCPLDQAFSIEQKLRAAVAGHIAIVNVSGGYSILELSGADARQVLMKSTGYDTHPEHFAAGKVVNTTFAKAQVTLRAVESDGSNAMYELIVRRSFSDYVWVWLQQAADEYGLQALSIKHYR